MTDPRPPGPRSDDAIEVFDLDPSGDGIVSGTPLRRRSAWLVGAAAALVLILGVATVLVVDRSGNDTITVATGASSTEKTYVLPPKDASIGDVTAESDVFYSVGYQSGGTYFRLVSRGSDGPPPSPPADSLGASATTDIVPFGTVYVACLGMSAGAVERSADSEAEPSTTSTIDPSRVSFTGPTSASWLTSSSYLTLQPRTGTDDESCEPPTEPDPAIVAAVRALRTVGVAEWQAFLKDNGVDISDPAVVADPVPATTTSTVPTTPDSSPSTTTVPGAPSATTVPPVTFPDSGGAKGDAQAQIAAAVANLRQRALDGSYPNLEDGTRRAAQYRAMFDQATVESMASQQPNRPPTSFTLESARFESPDRARITFRPQTPLPSGSVDATLGGEALLQDGRWVIAYDTVETTLAGAVLSAGPSGGEFPATGGR